jgi:hypothetical protein
MENGGTCVHFIGGENHWPVACHWQTLLHNIVSSTPHMNGIQTHNVTDCIGSCKSDSIVKNG